MVILDTNIVIDHLRSQAVGRDSKLERVVRKNPKQILAISMLTVQELYEGKSTSDSYKEQLLLATISPLKILPYTYEVAQLAGEIARDLDRPIELADAAIAATAVLSRGTLYTMNGKDFRGINDLDLVFDF
jgi:predicted nucleic acid-binding protein